MTDKDQILREQTDADLDPEAGETAKDTVTSMILIAGPLSLFA